MRKLTVKNFSVIKEAELEFGKITVLIGPQASGKSLLCKLAYFLGREVLMKAEDWIKQKLDFSVFEDAVRKDFENWFPRSGWGATDWSSTFVSDKYEIIVSAQGNDSQNPPVTSLRFSQNFTDIYKQESDYQRDHQKPWTEAHPRDALRKLTGNGFWDVATYIPSERTYFVDTSKGYRSLASDPDPIVRDFAVWYENSRSPEIPKPRMRRYLKGNLVRGDDSWLFAFDDGRVLPVSELSSGSKELLPLFSVLEMYEYQRPPIFREIGAGFDSPSSFIFDDFFIEEPEGHIFPDMQQELVRYFAEL